MVLILERVFVNIPSPRRYHPVESARSIGRYGLGQGRGHFVLADVAAFCNLLERIPPPLEAHFREHGFLGDVRCAGNFEVEGVER